MQQSEITFYNTQEIVAFMQSIQGDYVDGYRELDTNGLLQQSLQELGHNETTVPVEFEIALRDVVNQHKQ
jgi:hypothetical protein